MIYHEHQISMRVSMSMVTMNDSCVGSLALSLITILSLGRQRSVGSTCHLVTSVSTQHLHEASR